MVYQSGLQIAIADYSAPKTGVGQATKRGIEEYLEKADERTIIPNLPPSIPFIIFPVLTLLGVIAGFFIRSPGNRTTLVATFTLGALGMMALQYYLGFPIEKAMRQAIVIRAGRGVENKTAKVMLQAMAMESQEASVRCTPWFWITGGTLLFSLTLVSIDAVSNRERKVRLAYLRISPLDGGEPKVERIKRPCLPTRPPDQHLEVAETGEAAWLRAGAIAHSILGRYGCKSVLVRIEPNRISIWHDT